VGQCSSAIPGQWYVARETAQRLPCVRFAPWPGRHADVIGPVTDAADAAAAGGAICRAQRVQRRRPATERAAAGGPLISPETTETAGFAPICGSRAAVTPVGTDRPAADREAAAAVPGLIACDTRLQHKKRERRNCAAPVHIRSPTPGLCLVAVNLFQQALLGRRLRALRLLAFNAGLARL
jgi:hypothetical protein